MIQLEDSIDMLRRETSSAFESASSFPEGTAREKMQSDEFNISHNYSGLVPLLFITINGISREFSKPISLRIFKEDGFIFAENETLGIIGTGEIEMEAVDEFCNHLIHFYTYYNSLPWDKVIGEAKRLKKIYEQLFST